MITETIVNQRYPEDRKHYMLNLAVSIWFPGEKERIKKLGDAKRTAKYDKMHPLEMVVEPPIIRDGTKFKACLIDRKAGYLLPDRDVPTITFKQFDENAIESNKVGDGDYSAIVKEALKYPVDGDMVYDLIQDPSYLSVDPAYYLAHLKDTDEQVIVYDCQDVEMNLDDLIEWVFRGYDIEETTMSFVSGETEAGTIKVDKEDIESFITGTVTIKDTALTEQTKTFRIIDLQVMSKYDVSHNVTIGTLPDARA